MGRLSFDQLTACYNQPQTCGAEDVWAISDELTSRLHSLPSKRLVACFGNWKLCGVEDDQTTGWPISDELARRGYLHPLVARYWTESSPEVRDGIEHVAYHFQSSEAASFMREVLAKHLDDGEDLYWPVNYLSKKCEHAALAKLKSGRYRNQGSLQYQESVALFGKCAYRPAIPYLVDSALYDVSLNVVDAADSSLRRLFPGTPKEFDSLEQEQNYFCARAKRLGVQVHCHLQTCVIQ